MPGEDQGPYKGGLCAMAETWVRETTSQAGAKLSLSWLCPWESAVGGRFGMQAFHFFMLLIQDGNKMERALDASIDIALIGLAALLLIYGVVASLGFSAYTASLMRLPRAS